MNITPEKRCYLDVRTIHGLVDPHFHWNIMEVYDEHRCLGQLRGVSQMKHGLLCNRREGLQKRTWIETAEPNTTYVNAKTGKGGAGACIA